ncbi:MAG TPA: hypothetical protein PKE26_14965 [Kiritimatiellia bacterium]|nr:hypothetical protein [Kiritimatiellia bacterium]HMP00398.1 hypothetical protein [Kiritimatiellia bacterium]
MKTNDTSITDKSAAESAYGFFRQLDRVFLWLLLKAKPGYTVTFECVDDVGVHAPNGVVLAEQDKAFAAEDSNPLRNRSEALWKTLSNWIEECVAERLDPKTTKFLLWLSAPCEPGTWAEYLFAADTPAAAKAALVKISADLKAAGDAGKTKDVYRYISNVFARHASHSDIVTLVIANATKEHGTGSAATDLRNEFRTQYDIFDAAYGDEIIAHGKAWVDHEVREAVESRRPACMRVDDLKNRMEKKVVEIRNSRILPKVAPPSTASVDSELQASPTYICQLNWINEESNELLDAASVFLRSAQQRTVWADSSYWPDGAWDDLKANLLSEYRSEKTRARLSQGIDSVGQGQLVYAGCKQSCTKLATTWPADFIRGCMHTLANVPELGWHPDYERLVAKERETT